MDNKSLQILKAINSNGDMNYAELNEMFNKDTHYERKYLEDNKYVKQINRSNNTSAYVVDLAGYEYLESLAENEIKENEAKERAKRSEIRSNWAIVLSIVSIVSSTLGWILK